LFSQNPPLVAIIGNFFQMANFNSSLIPSPILWPLPLFAFFFYSIPSPNETVVHYLSRHGHRFPLDQTYTLLLLSPAGFLFYSRLAMIQFRVTILVPSRQSSSLLLGLPDAVLSPPRSLPHSLFFPIPFFFNPPTHHSLGERKFFESLVVGFPIFIQFFWKTQFSAFLSSYPPLSS